MPRQSDSRLYNQFIATQLERALAPAEVKKNPPLRYHPLVDDYTMSCGMDRTPGGRIWLAWFAGGDNDKAVIMLAYTDNEGVNFSEPQFMLDPGYADCGIHLSAVVGNLWTAPDGRLFLFFTQSLGYYDGRGGSWYSVCEKPDDNEPSWTKPARIWHGASLNKPTVLGDGTWLLPISLWKRERICIEAVSLPLKNTSVFFHELDPMRKAQVFASADQGRTWILRGGALNENPLFDEHMIIERKDGSLLMYLRDAHGMTESESRDRGHTWSPTKRTPFSSASARFFLRKLQSGNILLVKYSNPENPLARSHLTAYVSNDDCRTWNGGLLIDERSNISYPDGFQAPDGRIFIQYDRLRAGGEILMAIFTEDDVAAFKNISGKVILKRPAIQTMTARNEK